MSRATASSRAGAPASRADESEVSRVSRPEDRWPCREWPLPATAQDEKGGAPRTAVDSTVNAGAPTTVAALRVDLQHRVHGAAARADVTFGVDILESAGDLF